ncbi:hypothetical protein CLU79DRAFT_744178 [Phycomyces nitens]|nr:hypothetical protein CLU79DRAFT_744178 [Phycomyces nitens]
MLSQRLLITSRSLVCPSNLHFQQRAFHALRPTSVLFKAKNKKGGVVELLDENDPEFLEIEDVKAAEAALARELSKEDKQNSGHNANVFNSFYNVLVSETRDPKELHAMPKETRLNNLLQHVKQGDEAEKLPKLVEQWRNKRLPITPFTSSRLIQSVCETGRGDVAYELLGDRYRYGLFPNSADFEKTIDTLCKANELDKAVVTLAMAPVYKTTLTGTMYANLIEGFSGNDEEESLDKAVQIAEELIQSTETIENKENAKAALKKLADLLASRGDENKVQSIQTFVDSV